MKKDNIDNQLKPCPFCGSKVNSYKGFGGLVFIKCSVCGSMSKYQEALDRLLNDDYDFPHDFYEEDKATAMEHDVDTLQELVDKTTWVPVKKGLPDDRQVVLTIKNKHISILEYHADTKHWFETRGNWWWSYNMVDAWMPLPKPYLGSDEDDR